MYGTQLPPLSRPYSTRRRELTSPRALNAAIYQSTITRQVSDKQSFQPQKTSQKFVDDVDAFIQQSLITARTPEDEFKIHQQAFEMLIEKFDKQSPAMVVVKKGYDQLIEELSKQSQKGQQHKLVVQRSMTSLNNTLQVKQAEFEKKKKTFSDLLSSLDKTISDLKAEIDQLHKTLYKETKHYRKANAVANQNQMILQNLIKKIQKKHEQKDEFLQSIEVSSKKREELEIEATETRSVLTSVLTSISNSNRSIAQTHSSIESLEGQIEESDLRIKAKNDTIGQKAEETEILKNEIKGVNDDAQSVRDEINTLSRNMKIALQSAGISSHSITMIGDDPIKLAALAISHKKGFEGGIDPELFPDLA